MTTDTVAPNTIDGAAQQHTAAPSLDTIAAKMTAMRNHAAAARQAVTGASVPGGTDSPVEPTAPAEPEVDTAPEPDTASTLDEPAQEQPVSDSSTSGESNSTQQDIIDFIEFAETNPDARFRFMRNGREMIIDAKKAAAILGQGGAIHEEARELKIQRSEFEEYQREQRQRLDGLALAMEFTVQPQIQQAYDEIARTQSYQTTFQSQLAQVQDPAQRARIQASMAQNERYIQQQGEVIRGLAPRVDAFRAARRDQVREVLEQNRRNFRDRELKNEFVYNELREKVSRDWSAAREQLVPGVDNIDLISADEHILSLIRDGLKYRDRPQGKSAGASLAQVVNRRGQQPANNNPDQEISQLRERARGGDKKAADNLLVAQLARMRSARRG